MDDPVVVGSHLEVEEVEISRKPIQFARKEVENAIIEYVQSELKNNHVNLEFVEVIISYDLGNALSQVLSGHKVRFVINWNEKMQLNSIIKDFCKLYYTRNLRRTMEVIPYAWTNVQRKEWRKSLFNAEEEIIFDLLPKKRLEVIQREVTTIRDSVTGEEFSVEHVNKKQRFNGDDFKLWVAISRLVLSKQSENENG